METEQKLRSLRTKLHHLLKQLSLILCMEKGFPNQGKFLDLGVENNIVQKSGSWFSYGETRLGQGRDAVKQLIEDNPELAEELEGKIKEKLTK